MTSRTVLVGMSAREVAARKDLGLLAREHDATVAFLQLGDPSLARELTRLADAGARRVMLVGVSLGPLAPAGSWLRRLAAHWWRGRGSAAPEIDVATRLLDELTSAALTAATATTRPVTGREAGLTSDAWEHVSAHRHQVLLCRGPRCTALGSDASAEVLVLATMEHGLGDDDVLVTHTGCQLPCNRAPVVSVQPDDVWYGGVGPDVARRIVAEHLVGGRVVETHRLPRARPPLG